MTNSFSWLQSKYLKYHHRLQQCHLSPTNKYVSPVYSFLQQLLKYQNESKFQLQTNVSRFYLCFQSLHWQQTDNNQHHASSVQEKILGTTATWKATEICSTFIIIIWVTNTQDWLPSGAFYWYSIKRQNNPEDSTWFCRVRAHLYLIEIYFICNEKCWLLHKWFP